MSPYSIILADDHVLFRQGIRNILERDERLSVVGEAGDGVDVLELVKAKSPAMVILDISMPGLRGIEVAREIKMISRDTKILILTMHNDQEYACHAIAAGADGYLLKEDADTELFNAIDKLRRGDRYVSPLLAGELTHDLVHANYKGQIGAPGEVLSVREREVLKLIAEGATNRVIADLLFISVRTVENHRASIMRKLKIKNTAHLVKYAIRKGYTSTTV